MTKQFYFHILMGLPGSGKSHFAKETQEWYDEEFNTYSYIVDLDRTVIHYDDEKTTQESMEEVFNTSGLDTYGQHNKVRQVIVDGLILTKPVLKHVMELCLEHTAKFSKTTPQISFHIHKWNDDRETCEHNAGLRMMMDKEKNVTYTIKHIRFDNLTDEDVESILGDKKTPNIHISTITHHKVPRLSFYDVVLKPHDNSPKHEETMSSESWTMGGSCCNYLGNSWTMESEEPVEFTQYDDLLLKICPNITYLQYKKLYGECVKMDTWNESDYYGGSVTYGCWTCDLKKLYEGLKKLNLLENF